MKKNMNIEIAAQDGPQTPATRHPAYSSVPYPSAPRGSPPRAPCPLKSLVEGSVQNMRLLPR
jgi:hypothetical protein